MPYFNNAVTVDSTPVSIWNKSENKSPPLGWEFYCTGADVVLTFSGITETLTIIADASPFTLYHPTLNGFNSITATSTGTATFTARAIGF